MFKKPYREYNKISLNLLISYLSILVVPLCAIIAIYFVANNILLNNQIEKSANSMQQTAANINNSLVEAGNIAVYISDSKELSRIAQGSKDQFFDIYRFAQSSTDYNLINSNIDNVYVFFNDIPYIIKDKTVVPDEERFYNSLGRLADTDYSTFRQNLIKNVYNGNTLNIDVGKSLFVVQHFPYRSFENFNGTVIVKLNDKAIQYILSSSKLGNEGTVLMLEHRGESYRLQAYSGHISSDLDSELLLRLADPSTSDIKIGDTDYIVSHAQDRRFGFEYVSIIPKNAILNATSSVRAIIIVLSIITFALSLGICLTLWRRRRNLLTRINAYDLSSVSVRQPKFTTVWDSISNMLDNISSIQDRARRQESFINMSFVRKIVLGIYESEDALINDMNSVNASLEGESYIAISARFRFPSSLVVNQSQNILLVNDAFENFAYPKLFCEMSDDDAAIIIPLPNNFDGAKLKQELMQVIDELYDQYHIQSYMGIGKEVTQRVEIASSYEGAKRISDYLYYNDYRTVMTKDDAPSFKDTFFFPIETELQLIKTIKSAKKDDIADIFRMLKYENFEYRQLSPTMARHFIDMLKASLMRNLKEELHIEPSEEFIGAESLDEIYAYVMKYTDSIAQDLSSVGKQELDLKSKIEEQFELNYSNEQFNIATLASYLDMPESKLYNQIKSLLGMSFSDYLEQVRINKACDLLQQLTPVKDVSKQVGYNSDYSFRRAFKRIMGMPPSYYSEGFKKDK